LVVVWERSFAPRPLALVSASSVGGAAPSGRLGAGVAVVLAGRVIRSVVMWRWVWAAVGRLRLGVVCSPTVLRDVIL
jgi:hypothetical protein